MRKISIQCDTQSWKSGLYFLWVDDSWDDDEICSIANAVMNMVELTERGFIAK